METRIKTCSLLSTGGLILTQLELGLRRFYFLFPFAKGPFLGFHFLSHDKME